MNEDYFVLFIFSELNMYWFFSATSEYPQPPIESNGFSDIWESS